LQEKQGVAITQPPGARKLAKAVATFKNIAMIAAIYLERHTGGVEQIVVALNKEARAGCAVIVNYRAAVDRKASR
jgi:hypothetical protein